MLATPEWLHWSLECANTHPVTYNISGLKREQVVSDGGIEQVLSLTASKIEFATLPCTVNLGTHRITIEHAPRPSLDRPNPYVREENVSRVYRNTHQGQTAILGTSVGWEGGKEPASFMRICNAFQVVLPGRADCVGVATAESSPAFYSMAGSPILTLTRSLTGMYLPK